MKTTVMICALLIFAAQSKSQAVMTGLGDGYAEFLLTDTKYLSFDSVQYENPDPLGKQSKYVAKLYFGKHKFEITYSLTGDKLPIGGYIPFLKEHQVFSLTMVDADSEQYSLERTSGSITEKFIMIFIPAARYVTVLYLESTNNGKTYSYKYWGSGKY